MESKTVSELIEHLGIEPHTCHLACPGVFYLETVEYIAKEFSDQQNATLIAEHRLMKEALKRITNSANHFTALVIAEGALKNVTL